MDPSESIFDAFNDEEEVIEDEKDNKEIKTPKGQEKFTGKKVKRDQPSEQVTVVIKKKQKIK